MDIKDLLTEKEYFLYKKYIDRHRLKKLKKELEEELKIVMSELDKVSDAEIWRHFWVTREMARQYKSNLYQKIKRLWFTF